MGIHHANYANYMLSVMSNLTQNLNRIIKSLLILHLLPADVLVEQKKILPIGSVLTYLNVKLKFFPSVLKENGSGLLQLNVLDDVIQSDGAELFIMKED